MNAYAEIINEIEPFGLEDYRKIFNNVRNDERKLMQIRLLCPKFDRLHVHHHFQNIFGHHQRPIINANVKYAMAGRVVLTVNYMTVSATHRGVTFVHLVGEELVETLMRSSIIQFDLTAGMIPPFTDPIGCDSHEKAYALKNCFKDRIDIIFGDEVRFIDNILKVIPQQTKIKFIATSLSFVQAPPEIWAYPTSFETAEVLSTSHVDFLLSKGDLVDLTITVRDPFPIDEVAREWTSNRRTINHWVIKCDLARHAEITGRVLHRNVGTDGTKPKFHEKLAILRSSRDTITFQLTRAKYDQRIADGLPPAPVVRAPPIPPRAEIPRSRDWFLSLDY